MEEIKLAAIVMAGGQGTRFWPLSTPSHPKQYLALTSERTMIQETVDRVLPLTSLDHIFICTTHEQEALARQELPQVRQYILEPFGRNTAPCLMLSLDHLMRAGYAGDTVMVVLPADHFIQNTQAFRSTLEKAARFAKESKGLITLGILPTHAHTGYGYIEAGEGQEFARPIRQFIEKPSLERAQGFLKSRNFYWNSGMFLWRLDALAQAFELHLSESWQKIRQTQDKRSLDNIYQTLPSVPIDIGIMEKAKNGFVIPTDIGWNDIGSWNALHSLKSVNSAGNVTVSGTAKTLNSEGCLVAVSPGKKVALVGVRDLVVVECGDTLLIVDRNQDQLVRDASKLFK